MGLISKVKRLFEELQRVSQQRADQEYDDETFKALEELGLIDKDEQLTGNAAKILDESCNWEEQPRTKVLSDKYKGNVDAAAANKNARTKAARKNREDNSRVNG